MLTCYRRRRSQVVQRCLPVELRRQFRRVSDQTAAPTRRPPAGHRCPARRLPPAAQRRPVEGTVRPGRGQASPQGRAECVTPWWNNSVGRRASPTARPCRVRPPTEIKPTRSAELLAGTSGDLPIKQSFQSHITYCFIGLSLPRCARHIYDVLEMFY